MNDLENDRYDQLVSRISEDPSSLGARFFIWVHEQMSLWPQAYVGIQHKYEIPQIRDELSSARATSPEKIAVSIENLSVASLRMRRELFGWFVALYGNKDVTLFDALHAIHDIHIHYEDKNQSFDK